MLRKQVAAMTIIGLWVAFSASAKPLNLSGISLSDSRKNPVHFTAVDSNNCIVFVFLSPECPISQQYTLELNTLARQSNKTNVRFYGIIPGVLYDQQSINDFKEKYNVAFPLLMDTDFRLTHLLGASITPQVYVVNHNEIRYSGAIDNAYVSLGKKKAVTNAFYLKDALAAIQNNQEIKIKNTNATGCLIEFKNGQGEQ